MFGCVCKYLSCIKSSKYLAELYIPSIYHHFSKGSSKVFLPKIISNDYLTAPRSKVAKMLKCCFDSRRQQILSR